MNVNSCASLHSGDGCSWDRAEVILCCSHDPEHGSIALDAHALGRCMLLQRVHKKFWISFCHRWALRAQNSHKLARKDLLLLD